MEDLVSDSNENIVNYLYNLSQRRKNKSLDGDIYQECKQAIEENLRYSTKETFKNQFWTTLTPQIKNKIVKKCLYYQCHKLRFYFNDFETNVAAPQSFVTYVITNLESSLFDIGDVIIEKGSFIKDLIFMINGGCELNGFMNDA